MNASVNIERNSWRLPPDETVQVADPRSKSAQVKEDLTYAEGGHNWRSIVFSLLVIGFVIAGIVTAIYLLGYVDELLYWSGRRLTLDECLRDDLTPHRLPPTWVSHDKFVYQADDGSLTLLDTSNNTVALLVSNHTLGDQWECVESYALQPQNIAELINSIKKCSRGIPTSMLDNVFQSFCKQLQFCVNFNGQHFENMYH